MSESHAAGRKTETTLGLLALHLDRQLARLSEALDESLNKAGRISYTTDEYGHRRAGEIGHAMQIAKASARLISSLAKLDREFRHNISISRVEEPPGPLPRGMRKLENSSDPTPHFKAIIEAATGGDPPPDS
jgi:hypothetical protein